MKDFEPSEELQKSKRKLPHWEQNDCTYFITFRLADSMPKGKFDEWNEERMRWLRSRNLDVDLPLQEILSQLSPEQRKIYNETFWKGYHDLLDACHGECALRDPANSKIVADTLLFFDAERYTLGDFIIMPNHVYLVVKPQDGWKLSELLHSWKRFSSRKINEHMQREGKLWQPESYDHIVRNEAQLKRIQAYIKNNPKNLRESEFHYHQSRTAL
ncbi:hypothetical protein NT6N_35180 [Oceaniferula spumae]|uniref:Transposase IS200-like domain-containing protein n=1 Tax=Oceaniferula spumae TaxID=2979115 RepID=A0AAT9FR73_9BACT